MRCFSSNISHVTVFERRRRDTALNPPGTSASQANAEFPGHFHPESNTHRVPETAKYKRTAGTGFFTSEGSTPAERGQRDHCIQNNGTRTDRTEGYWWCQTVILWCVDTIWYWSTTIGYCVIYIYKIPKRYYHGITCKISKCVLSKVRHKSVIIGGFL